MGNGKNRAFDQSKWPNWIDPNEVIPYDKNAKLHDERQVRNVANSIRRFGWQQDTVLTRDKVLVIGHGRRLAALELGCMLPYHIVDKDANELTEEDIRELRFADNLTNESPWDYVLGALDMEGLAFDGFDFDFDDFVLPDDEEPQEVVEDEAPEAVETRCNLGDIWKLGNHRLICGDSTDPAIIDRLMDGVKAELLLTDPPYDVKIVKGAKVVGDKPFGSTRGEAKNAILKAREYAPIIGDDTTDTAKANFEIAKSYTDNQIIFGGNYFTDFLPPSRCWIIWDKGVPKDSFFAQVEMAWCSKDGNAKIYKYLWSGLCREGDRKIELNARVHPTQKPVGMLADILKDFSEENNSILDCFGGSGSTLIACEQLNRICYMCELDPHYCDVIIQRWENFTGEKAVLLNGE